MSRMESFQDGLHVVWCERCEKWTLLGQPYVMLEPGRFAHERCIGGRSRGGLKLIRGGAG